MIVDAASSLPPASNLRAFVQRGADLVIFSGGKALQGPQCSGLVLGRADLVEACRLHASPHHHLGRGMKVGREEVVGLVAAVERYLLVDHDAELRRWEARVAALIGGLGRHPALEARRVFPEQTGRPVPKVAVTLREDSPLGIPALAQRLARGNPSIRVIDYYGREVLLDPTTLEDDQVELVVAGFVSALADA